MSSAILYPENRKLIKPILFILDVLTLLEVTIVVSEFVSSLLFGRSGIIKIRQGSISRFYKHLNQIKKHMYLGFWKKDLE